MIYISTWSIIHLAILQSSGGKPYYKCYRNQDREANNPVHHVASVLNYKIRMLMRLIMSYFLLRRLLLWTLLYTSTLRLSRLLHFGISTCILSCDRRRLISARWPYRRTSGYTPLLIFAESAEGRMSRKPSLMEAWFLYLRNRYGGHMGTIHHNQQNHQEALWVWNRYFHDG